MVFIIKFVELGGWKPFNLSLNPGLKEEYFLMAIRCECFLCTAKYIYILF